MSRRVQNDDARRLAQQRQAQQQKRAGGREGGEKFKRAMQQKQAAGNEAQEGLHVGGQAKQEAQRALAAHMQALKQEQERLASYRRELERMIVEREAKKRAYAETAMRGEMMARGAVSANMYLKRLQEHEELQRHTIEDQTGVVAQHDAQVETAREDLILKNRDLEALEKHKEKWDEQIKRKIATKEAETADEVAQTAYLLHLRDP